MGTVSLLWQSKGPGKEGSHQGGGCSAVLSAEGRQPKSPNPGSSGRAFLFLLNSGIPLPNPRGPATLCQAKHSSLTCHKHYYFSGFHPSSQVSLLQTRTCTTLSESSDWACGQIQEPKRRGSGNILDLVSKRAGARGGGRSFVNQDPVL